MENVGNGIQTSISTKKIFCSVHNSYFTQKTINILGHIVETTCPKCSEDRKAREEYERKLESERFINSESSFSRIIKDVAYIDRIFDSGLTKQMIDFEPQQTENFERFSEHLDIKTNLVVYGDTGTGKTRFLAEIIKRACKHSKSFYINAIDLLNLNVKDFRFSNKFKSIRESSILAIDECHNLLKLDRDIFELIVDSVYSNDGFLVMSGNIEPSDLKDIITDRIKSRLSEKGLSVVKFFGQDMRINGVNKH